MSSTCGCGAFIKGLQDPFGTIKIIMGPERFDECTIEAMGAAFGKRAFAAQAKALVDAGAIDALERCLCRIDGDLTHLAIRQQPIGALTHLATLVGNTIRHRDCPGCQPPSPFTPVELDALAARLRELAARILRGIEPARIGGANYVKPDGTESRSIGPYARASFVSFLQTMLEPRARSAGDHNASRVYGRGPRDRLPHRPHAFRMPSYHRSRDAGPSRAAAVRIGRVFSGNGDLRGGSQHGRAAV